MERIGRVGAWTVLATEMDELEATRLIRARWPDRAVQIVAMTANVAPEDVLRAHEAGMDGFLGKPIAVNKLASLLRASANAQPPPTPASAPTGPARPDPVPADPAPGADDPVARLCALIGTDAVRQVADLFLTAVEEAMPDIDAACREHDRQLLAGTAHRLKSSAGNLGAQSLGDLLHELAEEAPSADWPRLDELVTRVQAQRLPTRDRLAAQLGTV